ncbi:PEP/pyruvate-binding domain-containing protein, partial [Virgisporangium ochraceum]|uniref:PEP/pyruvate-binding domain-containing protein n=1 Tax=Virgisporangium ochraceum TaxID=65505 RepID=UPI001943D404
MIVELRAATVATCGGKAGVLGLLLRAGIRVPDGYVIPSGSPVPAVLDGPGGAVLDGPGGAVAVRSSASTEDLADASAAGQHDSVLGVRGADAIAGAVRACRESLWSERAVAYRRARGLTAEPVMAVLVQRHVDADVAGVAFTGDAVRIEAAWGLGESVVHGLVTPDSWTVLADRITARSVGDKRERVDRAPAGGTARTPVAAGDRERPCLSDGQVRRVAATCRRIAEILGTPVDVEWAVAGDELWVLQARPVTAELPGPAGLHGPAELPGPAGLPGPAELPGP